MAEWYSPTSWICYELDIVGLPYDVARINVCDSALDVVCVPLSLAGGPTLNTYFVIDDVHHSVTHQFACGMDTLGFNSRIEALEVINEMNKNSHLTKFFLDDEGNIEVRSDLPCSISKECVGEAAVEAYTFAAQYLNIEFVKALQRNTSFSEDSDVDREVAIQVRDANFLITLMSKMEDLNNASGATML